MLNDLRYAARMLIKSPGFAGIAILSLALGIGVNVAIMTAVNAVFLASPTATDPKAVVFVEPGNGNLLSYPNFIDLRESRIFDDLTGFRLMSMKSGTGDAAERATTLAITGNFFETLGIGARWGRIITEADLRTDPRARLAVLSHGYWVRRFAADPGLVGKPLSLNGEPFVVLGVLPPGHRAVTAFVEPDLYVPLTGALLPKLDSRKDAALSVIGRLTKNSSREHAQAALTAFGKRLAEQFPESNRGMDQPAKVIPFQGSLLHKAPREFKLVPILLLGLFGLVLLIACGNVAGLLLTRAAGRRREIAIRAALGASRRQLVQGMLLESMLVAFLGAAMGLVFAGTLLTILANSSMPGASVVRLALKPSLTLYALGTGFALLTGLLCGLMPAISTIRARLVAEIQQGGSQNITPRLRLRHAVVVGQVAAATTLLVVSSLFLRSLARLSNVDPGFDLDHGLVARVEFNGTQYSGDGYLQMTDQIVRALEGIPGVESASMTNTVPLSGDSNGMTFQSLAQPGAALTDACINSVGPNYFRTMGIPLIRGRTFAATDRAGAPPVVIVSQAFASACFGQRDPIGQIVVDPAGAEAMVIGVVRDSKYEFLGESPKPLLYFPYAQRPGNLTAHVRFTASQPEALIPQIKRSISDLDPTATTVVQTLHQATSAEFRVRRTAIGVLGSLTLLGLFLAVIGLYGVMSHVVTSRTSEIGIRMTLGASRGRVLLDIIQQGLKVVGLGMLLGMIASILLTQPMSILLAGVSPFDPIALGGTALALVFTGLLASYVPARRAASVDPMKALRST